MSCLSLLHVKLGCGTEQTNKTCLCAGGRQGEQRQIGASLKDWKKQKSAEWSSVPSASDKLRQWQACPSCVLAFFLLHYSLYSFGNNMSTDGVSQSAHVPCCSCLFTGAVWALPPNPLPTYTPFLFCHWISSSSSPFFHRNTLSRK